VRVDGVERRESAPAETTRRRVPARAGTCSTASRVTSDVCAAVLIGASRSVSRTVNGRSGSSL
jgi:hypothetical protein